MLQTVLLLVTVRVPKIRPQKSLLEDLLFDENPAMFEEVMSEANLPCLLVQLFGRVDPKQIIF